MHSSPDHGRVYRRCGCRDDHRRQFGTRCPHLATDPHHGTWAFAVGAPTADGRRRRTIRRSGFPDETDARIALRRFNESLPLGVVTDPRQSTADYLTSWLTEKELHLKPTTIARYRDYITQDLIPALGAIPLDDLTRQHLAAFVTDQLRRHRGRVTVHRIVSTLSSALATAVDTERLARNPAKPPLISRPAAAERHLWTEEQAARFLRFTHLVDPLYADLAELMIGTGMRKGEVLALRWDDVHLPERTLFIRATLSAIDNNQLLLTAPKTKGSRAWVALSDRVVEALEEQTGSRAFGQITHAGGYVFHRHGRPLHPKTALDRFHLLCDKAGVPRIALHDLRHLAASFALAAGTPLPVVSKTLRHRTLSTTANIYAELTHLAARAAVDAISWTLNTADRAVRGEAACRARRPWHQNPRPHQRLAAHQTSQEIEPPTAWPMWPGDHTATTSRQNIKKAAPARSGNGLRPAVKQVGTTGFEPATP
ncbi:site-specific integrase [Streptomyces sp. SP17BM10]|uniref:tyrosine-type recombinase/integrase n=1 Tax=Streptomyces sp. SP17BM10 TaxID=3002530 RepID=UPI002E78DF32|nr:site-specific integrase [Streptomyces sp. SP17BM10]MEE1781683.1 site-specific integrase [Streptomyces sp. SP17BM10]